jgi:purine-cytosine permease-like protein
MFAGEHIAATEFVIGALFVIHGVSARNLILGLFLGNVLAVLSYAFVCAPIATRTRLTLYWYFRKIGGPGLSVLFNTANAVLFCIVAGAMISVSATSVGLGFAVKTPTLKDLYPTSVGWVVVTLCVGMVVTIIAMLGFEKLSEFSQVCSPWLVTVFFAGALALLPTFGKTDTFSHVWQIATTRIWTGIPSTGQEKYTLWHIVFFAWFANLSVHIGLSDMALLRYAKKWTYGFFSATGMFLGHFFAWMCSGIMVAAVGREMNPGLMAYTAAGLAGAMAVVIAGWTSANPNLYRAGLALQTITPNWKRWKITLAAGLVTSVLACFPLFFMHLLDFAALYGLILMPIGAIVFTEHWIFPRLNWLPGWAEKRNLFINWPALISWILSLAVVFVLPIHLFFKALPGYFIAMICYLGLSYFWGVMRRNGRHDYRDVGL